MWRTLYRDEIFRWYSYPFFHGLAACFFLAASVSLYAHVCRNHRLPDNGSDAAFSPGRVLDFSLLFFLIYTLASKAGSLAYTRPEHPLAAFVGVSRQGLTSHTGVFFLALLSLLRVGRLRSLDRLWQLWAGPFVMAVGLGYLGCFAYGCCFGTPVSGDPWWSVRYPIWLNSKGYFNGAPALVAQMDQGILPETAAASLPMHPVQLYSMALLVLGGALIAWGALRKPWTGWFLLAATYLMLVRVVLDSFRGDHVPGVSEFADAPAARIVLLVVLTLLLTGHIALSQRKRLSPS